MSRKSPLPAATPHGPSDASALPFAIGGLIAWRMIEPAEAAASGATLWIAQVWLLLAAVWSLLRFARDRGRFSLRWDRHDVLLWGLIAAHWVSAAMLWKNGGDKRAALNLCWEWTALGVGFLLLRQTNTNRREAAGLVRLLVQFGIIFAGLGLWQHYVEFPALDREYRAVREEFDALTQRSQDAPRDYSTKRRLEELRVSLAAWQVPEDPVMRMMFEHRLAHTREPIARWALTNSLGGWLALTAVVLMLPALRKTRPEECSFRSRLFTGVLAAPVLVCLYLTQCKTAWVAVFAALAAAGAWRWCRDWRGVRRSVAMLPLLVVALIVPATFFVGANASNDPGVSVTNKSLRYRLQYLTATSRLLADNPTFGVGPGNFRQRYVAYKVPAASEEILDPHNLFYDLWASGGLAALLIFGSLLTSVLWRAVVRTHAERAPQEHPPDVVAAPCSTWHWGACCTLALLFLSTLLLVGNPDWEILACLALIPLLEFGFTRGLPRAWRTGESLIAVSAWGALAVGIHLLGAGGIEMPVFVQAGLVILAVATCESPAAIAGQPASRPALRHLSAAAVSLGLFLGCFFTTTRPVVMATGAVERARQGFSTQPAPRVRRDLATAAAADPLWAEPWRDLAYFEFSQWLRDPTDEYTLKDALAAADEAKQRDPHNYKDDRQVAEAYDRVFQQTGAVVWAERATGAYAAALERYPTHSRLLADGAIVAAAAGEVEKSRIWAESAIAVDELNRREEHWEKVQTEAMRRRLEELVQ